MRKSDQGRSHAGLPPALGWLRWLPTALLLLAGGSLAGGSSSASATTLLTGEELELPVSGCNRAMSMHVLDATVESALEGRTLPPGHQWLVLTLRIENWMPSDLIFGLDYLEALLIASLDRQLYLLINDRQIARANRPPGSAFKEEIVLPTAGSKTTGQVAFSIPVDNIHALSLRFYHDQYAAIHADLITPDATAPPVAGGIAGAPENNLMAMAVQRFAWHDELGGSNAPAGSRWLAVTLRGQSLWSTSIGDARAFDATAPLDAGQDVPKVMEYVRASGLLQVVVDDRHGYVRHQELSSLPIDPPWLPDAWAGGEAVFLIPDDAVRIELVAHFPEFRGEDISSDVRPAMGMVLHDGDASTPRTDSVAEIADTPISVTIHAVNHVESHGEYAAQAGETLLLLELSMRNASAVGGMMHVGHRFLLALAGDDDPMQPLAGYQRGPLALVEPFWLPADSRPREFKLLYRIPADARLEHLKYMGISMNTEIELIPGSER